MTPWVKLSFWIYLLFLVWAYATVMNPADPDLWHRLAVGEFLWRTGHFPNGETFSYLDDYYHIADHEWGGVVVFFALWSWGGGAAMVVAKLLTLTVTLTLVVWAGKRNRRPTAWLTAFYALVLIALLPSFQSTLRCMVFTHIFFALWLYWFQRERQGRAVPTYLYVLTMIIWANLHGGFAVGLLWLLLVTGLEALYHHPWKKWLARLGLCTAATLLNPFGVQLWISTARALTAPRHGFDEWAPVTWFTAIGSYPGYKVLLVTLIVALAIQVYRRGWKTIDHQAVILVGIFMLLAMTSARHTSLFALVAGALVPSILPLKWPHILSLGPVRRLVVMAINTTLLIVPLFAALMMISESKELTLGYPADSCPIDAVSYLETEKVEGNLLVPFNYGSYALWQLRGRMRVSMDGRYDLVYEPKTYQRVEDFFAARGDWQGLLTKPAPDAILLPRASAIYPLLRTEPGWKEVWVDPIDAVFVPRTP